MKKCWFLISVVILLLVSCIFSAALAEDGQVLGTIGKGYGKEIILTIDVFSEHTDTSGWIYYSMELEGKPFQSWSTFSAETSGAKPSNPPSEPLGRIGRGIGDHVIIWIDVYREHVGENGWAHYRGSYKGKTFEFWVTFDAETAAPPEVVLGSKSDSAQTCWCILNLRPHFYQAFPCDDFIPPCDETQTCIASTPWGEVWSYCQPYGM